MYSLLAQSNLYDYDYSTTNVDSGSAVGLAIFSGVWLLFWLVFAVVAVIAMWKVFTKAGKPGWAAIVPIYNTIVLLEIIGRPVWWFLLLFIPFVNIIVSVVVALDLAKAFGKDAVFGIVALWLFSIVGMLILGFGDAKYQGAKPMPLGTSTGATPPVSQ